MEKLEKLPSCEQKECPVRESGKCLEGLTPEECSHFYLADAGTEDDDTKASANSSEPQMRLFEGTELKVAGLGLVTNNSDTNLIIIIGESNSGKTTILTSIYDMFQTAKFSKYYFAGSMTQYGFESRCHLSRDESGAKVADTLHTTAKDFNFLHLAIKEADKPEELADHLLLSDISGERFRMANDSSADMIDMDLVRKADHLVFLLDGDKIAGKFERTAATTRAGQFLTRALDTGLFDGTTKLMIIFTKADVLQPMVEDGSLEKIKAELTNRFGSRLAELTYRMVAARPKPPTALFPFGYGMEGLLTLWKTRAIPDPPVLIPLTSPDRYFDLYQANHG